MNTDDFIRERITSLRIKKGVSEMQMSREIGKSPTYLSAVMSKNFDYPEKPLKYKHIRRISD